MNGVVRCAVASLAALGALACSESSVPPTAPTPLPSGKIGELAIACPADVMVRSRDGTSATVAYPPPNVAGGQAPVTTSCTPPSGSAQSIGRFAGSCASSDRLGQTARCDFAVSVLPPARLGVTTILAFGDSLTFSSAPPSHVSRLQRRLRTAYPAQSPPISVVNGGRNGEHAAQAAPRLQEMLDRIRPDAVLIMEGTNDLTTLLGAPTAAAAAARAADALDEMVRTVRRRRAAPVLATIPPIGRGAGAPEASAAVADLNRRIRMIASGRGVPLVDVHAVVSGGGCPGAGPLPCLDDDGVHLTDRAYALIADAFFAALVGNFDASPPVPAAAAMPPLAGSLAPGPPDPAGGGR